MCVCVCVYMYVFADKKSPLVYITSGKSDGHLKMLEGEVVKHLLDAKWKTYAKVYEFVFIDNVLNIYPSVIVPDYTVVNYLIYTFTFEVLV